MGEHGMSFHKCKFRKPYFARTIYKERVDMPLPINVITPALKLLSEKIDILPASGGAVEDLQRPDEDELEDMLINRDSKEITSFAEIPEPSMANFYRSTPPIPRPKKHLYRFFIDGSLRTYYL